jgi:hypothetical protein
MIFFNSSPSFSCRDLHRSYEQRRIPHHAPRNATRLFNENGRGCCSDQSTTCYGYFPFPLYRYFLFIYIYIIIIIYIYFSFYIPYYLSFLQITIFEFFANFFGGKINFRFLGRPNIHQEFTDVAAKTGNHVLAMVCGPAPMVAEVETAALKHRFELHMETFEL